MKDAVIRYYGTVKEAAFALGQVDPSLMMREFDAAKFGRFDAHADDAAKAFVAEAVHQSLGQVEDPRARAKRTVRELMDKAREIEAFLEFVS